MTGFRSAVDSRDVDSALASLSERVVFRSPLVYSAYYGRDAVEPVLRAVFEVFDGVGYTRTIEARNGRDQVLVFVARIGEVAVEGVDVIHLDDAGLIDELTVMVRPFRAVEAVARAVRSALAAEPSTGGRRVPAVESRTVGNE